MSYSTLSRNFPEPLSAAGSRGLLLGETALPRENAFAHFILKQPLVDWKIINMMPPGTRTMIMTVSTGLNVS